MSNSKTRSIEEVSYPVIVTCLSALFLVLNIARVINVPVTQDEGWTYLLYLKSSYANIVNCIPATANNHFLNSLLGKLFIDIFGTGQFVLRLPAFLAHIGYMAFTALLIKKLVSHKWWMIGCFILLNINPFMFEFWGMTRGYALAMAFMCGSLYYMVSYVQSRKPLSAWLSVLMAALAVYSILTLLYYFIALSCVLVIITFAYRKHQKGLWVKVLSAIVVYALFLYLLLVNPVKVLLNGDGFVIGRTNGFITDTIGTLIKESLFLSSTPAYVVWLSYLVVVITVLIGIYWVRLFFSNKNQGRIGLTLWLLLVIPYICIEIQHLLLGTLYITDRAGLFFIPLFTLCFSYTVYHLYTNASRIYVVLFNLCMMFGIACFGFNINLKANHYWHLDSDNIAVLERISKQTNGWKRKVKLHAHWLYYPSLAYYVDTRYTTKFEPLQFTQSTLSVTDTTYDYCYISDDDTASISTIYKPDTIYAGGKAFLVKKYRGN